MNQIIKIDFSSENLYWYEIPKSKQVIDSLRQAIKKKNRITSFFCISIRRMKIFIIST